MFLDLMRPMFFGYSYDVVHYLATRICYNGHLQLLVSTRDSHENLPAIGGVHKLQNVVEEKPKEFHRKIWNFNNRGGLITTGTGYVYKLV